MNESIKSYDEYRVITGMQLNSARQKTIPIKNKDQFLYLQNSYLLIEGNMLKADNARYADADLIALTNNGLLYLFSSLKLTLVKLFLNICKGMWIVTKMVSRHQC